MTSGPVCLKWCRQTKGCFYESVSTISDTRHRFVLKNEGFSELEVYALDCLRVLLSLDSPGGTEENYDNLRVVGTHTWGLVNTR